MWNIDSRAFLHIHFANRLSSTCVFPPVHQYMCMAHVCASLARRLNDTHFFACEHKTRIFTSEKKIFHLWPSAWCMDWGFFKTWRKTTSYFNHSYSFVSVLLAFCNCFLFLSSKGARWLKKSSLPWWCVCKVSPVQSHTIWSLLPWLLPLNLSGIKYVKSRMMKLMLNSDLIHR